MRQVLVIFRKDASHLWPRLLPAFALTAVMGWLDSVGFSSPLEGLVEILWVLSYLYAGACLIHEETLPGDHQFWLTRPYDWRRLLAAKLLFLALFAALPLMTAEAVALAVNGLSPARYAAPLLSTAAAFAGAVALIAAALAAVTETLVQLLWAVLALAAVESFAAITGSGSGGWIAAVSLGAVIAAAGMAVLLVQYAFRKTLLSRGIVAGAVLIAAATPYAGAWHAGWMLHAKLFSPPVELPQVLVAFDPADRNPVSYAEASRFPGPGQEGLYLPVRVSGIPDGASVITERISANIETKDGTRWNSGWVPAGGLTPAGSTRDLDLIRAAGPAWLYVNVDRSFYRAVQDSPVQIDVSLALVLLKDRAAASLSAPGRTAHLPQEGICELIPGPPLSNGVRGVRNLIAFCGWPGSGPAYAALRTGPSETPLRYGSQAPLWPQGSVWQRESALFSVREGVDVRLETWRAAAYFDRDLTIPQIRLKDYAAPRATDLE